MPAFASLFLFLGISPVCNTHVLFPSFHFKEKILKDGFVLFFKKSVPFLVLVNRYPRNENYYEWTNEETKIMEQLRKLTSIKYLHHARKCVKCLHSISFNPH